MSDASNVARWLGKAGLSRFLPRFVADGVTDDQFKALELQDFARFGVDASADRQKLLRVIKSLNPRAATPPGGDSAALPGGTADLAGEAASLLGEDTFSLLPDRLPRISSGGRPATVFLDDGMPRIRVIVRKRPLNSRERARGEEDVVSTSNRTLTVTEHKVKVDLTNFTVAHEFAFDDILDEAASNDAVYARAVAPLVAAVLRRAKACCFAYGQTGSGKTFTMQPLPARAAAALLDGCAADPALAGLRLQLHVSHFEIYGGRIFDLLAERRKLCIRESGAGEVCVVGLSEHHAPDVAAVLALAAAGAAARSTGSTGANADSSRSHAILQLSLRPPGEGAPLFGKASFIDLAGSERGADTADTDRQTRLEGAEINKSLLALKECIRALDQERAGGRHIPFRGSKLTEVLRDSFGGDGRTVMIANINPAAASCEHTLNTLRYADRVKELRRDGRRPRAEGAAVGAAAAAMPLVSEEEEEGLLAAAHADLMQTILEEEEACVTAHRAEVDATMAAVRREMALLTEVDRAGSAIDAYVSGLADILAARAASTAALQQRLDTLQRHLREEEILSRSIAR